jgi:hypothetical protein
MVFAIFSLVKNNIMLHYDNFELLEIFVIVL